MKVLFLEWNCFGGSFVISAMERRGWQIAKFDLFCEKEDTRYSEKLTLQVAEVAKKENVDFIFSLNYYPVAAIAGAMHGINYVSWTYDSPSIQLYSQTISYPTNIACIFDYSEYLRLKLKGVETVHYLPLASAADYFDSISISAAERKKYDADVAMVGSMYSEDKHRLSKHFEKLDLYTTGYLDALKKVQFGLYGINVIPNALTEKIIKNIQAVCPIFEKEDGIEDIDWVIDKYFLCRDITAQERHRVISELGNICKVKLYTNNNEIKIKGVENVGKVEYYTEMPKAFKCAKININVTLKSIETGIPLRAFDIMACKGFLLTNYQADYDPLFVRGEDYEIYEDYNDLVEKVRYYLNHTDERLRIAENGYKKVKELHSYDKRLDQIELLLINKGH